MDDSFSLGMKFGDYQLDGFYDEMFLAPGEARPEARLLIDRIENLGAGDFMRRQESAERALMRMGITFNVYGAKEGAERIFPFDIVPRIVSASCWEWIERGLRQRIRALNLFIDDIYHQQRIVGDGVIPAGNY